MNYVPHITYWSLSPPCRAVLLTLKGRHVDEIQYREYFGYYVEEVDVLRGQHLTDYYVSNSPTRKVPVFWNGSERYVWESRAIISHIARHDDFGEVRLQPETIEDQTMVEQLLFFNNGTLYASWADYFYPQVHDGRQPDKAKLAKVEKALQVLDRVLEGRTHLVGDRFTIADFDYLACISSFEASDVDFLKYPNIKRWYEHVKSTAHQYERANGEGLAKFKEFTQLMLSER